ncbi:MAG TPA: tol-pal system protein YbgF [Methylomirabilota bacterium]|nr:tol-pal system protein YbgF [Methylomirabilota bacterium]
MGGDGAGHRRIRQAAGAVGLALVTGCAGTEIEEAGRRTPTEVVDLSRAARALGEELSAVRTEVARLRADLEALRAEAREATRAGAVAASRQDETLEALGRRLAAREQEAAAAGETLAALETTVAGLGDHVARIEALAARPAPERPVERPVSVPPPRPRPAALSADELFERATESLRTGELGQAVLDLEEFLAKYPGHPQATAAKFWIAEAYFRAREFAQAAVEYEKVVGDPPGDRTPEALLKLGLAQRALRREERARETWGQLIRDYPDSEAAQKARAALREPARAPVR